MALKSRFYLVSICDGHGPSSGYFPAQSREDIRNIFPHTSHQKIESVDYVGQFKVAVRVDHEFDRHKFVAEVMGKTLIFQIESFGYVYLTQLFAKEVNGVNQNLEDQRRSEF